ncbi:MAG: hypothetical protein K2N14_01950 [Clostridia bacterium]|nr:hypothetical protein [Clostridia bacterium]
MIESVGMDGAVASLTTLCTPHKGSQIASQIMRLPKITKKFVAFWINLAYRIFGDKRPDSLKVCEQLQSHSQPQSETLNISPNVYCQSYSSTLEKSRDDFIMGIPLIFSKHFENDMSDGLVSVESSKFGEYKGDCIDGSISHVQIAGFALSKKKKDKIYAFYLNICKELSELNL